MGNGIREGKARSSVVGERNLTTYYSFKSNLIAFKGVISSLFYKLSNTLLLWLKK